MPDKGEKENVAQFCSRANLTYDFRNQNSIAPGWGRWGVLCGDGLWPLRVTPCQSCQGALEVELTPPHQNNKTVCVSLGEPPLVPQVLWLSSSHLFLSGQRLGLYDSLVHIHVS